MHPDFTGKRLTADARRAILANSWPGNVRELKSAVERAILMSDSDEITAADLTLNGAADPSLPRVEDGFDRTGVVQHWLPAAGTTPGSNGNGSDPDGVVVGMPDGDIVPLDDLKRRAVKHAYRICEGNVDRAAVELGIGRATMYRLLKKYEVMR